MQKGRLPGLNVSENAVILEPDASGYENMTAYAVKKCEEFLNGRF